MNQPNLNGITHTSGDWVICLDENQGWTHIDITSGGGGGGGAKYLNDLIDVDLGGSGPFAASQSVRMPLANRQLFKYDSEAGQWKNTDLIEGGTF